MLMGGSAAVAEQMKARHRASPTAAGWCESSRMVFIESFVCRLSVWLCHGWKPRRPGAAPAGKLLHCRHAQRLGVVPEHAIKRPPLAVVRNERHRIILPVPLGIGLRQNLDGMID